MVKTISLEIGQQRKTWFPREKERKDTESSLIIYIHFLSQCHLSIIIVIRLMHMLYTFTLDSRQYCRSFHTEVGVKNAIPQFPSRVGVHYILLLLVKFFFFFIFYKKKNLWLDIKSWHILLQPTHIKAKMTPQRFLQHQHGFGLFQAATVDNHVNQNTIFILNFVCVYFQVYTSTFNLKLILVLNKNLIVKYIEINKKCNFKRKIIVIEDKKCSFKRSNKHREYTNAGTYQHGL